MRRVADGRVVNRHHHVSYQKTGPLGRRARLQVGYDCTPALDPKLLSQFGCDILDQHADPTALDLPVRHDLLNHVPGHVDRNRKADPNIAAALRENGRVDPDQPAIQRDQRAARVARVDGSVRLDEVLVTGPGPRPRTPKRRDDAGRDGLAKAEGIAYRKHKVAHLNPITVTERHGCKLLGLDAQDG